MHSCFLKWCAAQLQRGEETGDVLLAVGLKRCWPKVPDRNIFTSVPLPSRAPRVALGHFLDRPPVDSQPVSVYSPRFSRGPLCDDRPVNQRFHVRQSQFITPPMFLHLASHRSSQVARVWHVSVVGFSAGRWNGEKGKVSLTVIWSQMIHWGEKDILRHWAALSTHLCPLSLRLLLRPVDSIYGNAGGNVAHLTPVRQKRKKNANIKKQKSLVKSSWKRSNCLQSKLPLTWRKK